MIQITDHLAETRRRVTLALAESSRPYDDIIVVAVSKQHSADSVREAYRSGQRHFGESYVQEAIEKQNLLADLEITWHFLGRVQTNKAATIAQRFDWVHSVDRMRVARRLANGRPPELGPLNVLIQVNQAGESQKGGVDPDRVEPLANVITNLPALQLRGLMTIPPADSDMDSRAAYFRNLRDMGLHMRELGIPVEIWSMGMSGDFELAIRNGANCVRIGTAIFGPRLPRSA